jgi:hypothetical protein
MDKTLRERWTNTNPTKHQVWSQVFQVLIVGNVSWDENIVELLLGL